MQSKKYQSDIEPHPLDYDWRFDDITVECLLGLVKQRESTLALGTPTIARAMERIGHRYLLVDRQPALGLTNQLCIDLSISEPDVVGFGNAVLDPPWYVDDYFRWLSLVPRMIIPSTEIFCTLWPENTRPTATAERDRLFHWLSEWSDFEVLKGLIHYSRPVFEKTALMSLNSTGSPLIADLLVIRPGSIPKLFCAPTHQEVWTRFVINDYQIALRSDPPAFGSPNIRKLPLASGWNWPHVSRRAEGRSRIGIWSSRNEVAEIQGSSTIIGSLRKWLADKNREKLEKVETIHQLKDWHLGKIEISRVTEWVHRA